jgi:hypothetical protein
MTCPSCFSPNTYFSAFYLKWKCTHCSYTFLREEAYNPKAQQPKLVGYTEEGGHWYQLASNTPFLLTKAQMKVYEKAHINPELTMPNYDPLWSHHWRVRMFKASAELKAYQFLKSLSSEQLQELERKVF